eukprot:858535-Rhodomonas_salina.1
MSQKWLPIRQDQDIALQRPSMSHTKQIQAKSGEMEKFATAQSDGRQAMDENHGRMRMCGILSWGSGKGL